MKLNRWIFLGSLLLLSPLILKAAPVGGAAKAGEIGVGVQLGVPIGVSAKYWIDNKMAVQTAIGTWSSDFTMTADLVWHDLTALRPASGGGDYPGFYLGGGLYGSGDDDDEFGVRLLAGLNYFFPNNPFEIYAELAPTLIIEDDTEGDLTGGMGMRYYFR